MSRSMVPYSMPVPAFRNLWLRVRLARSPAMRNQRLRQSGSELAVVGRQDVVELVRGQVVVLPVDRVVDAVRARIAPVPVEVVLGGRGARPAQREQLGTGLDRHL